VTLTATVADVPNSSTQPTGTVTFKDGSTTLGTGTLSSGVATYSTTSLPAGLQSLTAVYGGVSGTFLGSASVVSPDAAFTVAAGGGRGGDGGQASAAQIDGPAATVSDFVGDLFVASKFDANIREVAPSGVISTFAGRGGAQDSGDYGPASQANVGEPDGLAYDSIVDPGFWTSR
jgi:hypothetical protein